jgi:hypothetical protein
MAYCQDTTFDENTQVLLLRILEDGREDIPKGDGYNQPVACSPDEGYKDDTTDTTSVLRHRERRVAFIPKIESCSNLDVKKRKVI